MEGDLLPVRRSRLVACCALLIGLAMVQDPGLLVPDTKFDLVAAPLDWLSRSLHVWDGQGGFGQVQNQAHGYLWPMGPFFLFFDAIGVPGWVIQRLWQSLVLCVACVGMAKLARAFRIRSDVACLVAAFAYALSPRMLTSLGPISIEVWPSALAPWVLLPLVIGAERGSARRAAALSAFAVAMVGGVNAAATLAVIPLAVLWILTRAAGPRRRSMMLWWPVFTVLATAWWIVPLLVMGSVSPPFLDFTETSAITTFPTTIFDAMRGTSHWVPYIDPDSRAGNDLIRTGWLAVNTAVVVVVGLVGLLDRRIRHRTFLVLAFLVGLFMVTAGHQGAVQGWFAGELGTALDGVLGPLRNVHKFDPVLRVPVLLGLAFVVDHAIARWPRSRAKPTRRAERANVVVLVGAVVLGVVGSAAPALAGRVEPNRAMLEVPSYWSQAADFVAQQSDGATTLLVPGSAFGDYRWGEPHDEPFQWLATSRWAVRSVGILAEPGHIRMLAGLERRFAEGHGSAGLAAALRRAGIEQLVVRNDLRPDDDVPTPASVHQAIAETPGLVLTASFGPPVGGDAFEAGPVRTVYDGGRRASYPAIEIFALSGTAPAVVAGEPTLVAAGPENLPDLLDTTAIGPGPVQFLADADPDENDARPRRVVLTDGLRARERVFARMHDDVSATFTPGDRRHTTSPVRDLVLGANDDDRWSTTARLDGARSVSASGAASDAGTAGVIDRGSLPYAALDGASDTAWRSGWSESAPWWQLDLDSPVTVRTVRVVADREAPRQRLRVRTAAGRSAVVELSPGGSRQVRVPASEVTAWVRVESAEAGTLALAEVEVPGVEVKRTLALPELPRSWAAADAVVLRADRDGRTGCVAVDGGSGCAAGTVHTGEAGPVMRRSFTLGSTRSYELALTARPRAGPHLDDLIVRDQPVTVRASSVAVPDPRAGAVATVDGDAGTAWLASVADDHPELDLGWLGIRSVHGLVLGLEPGTAARRPTQLGLTFWRGERRVGEHVADVDADGTVAFPEVRADRVTIQVRSAERVVDARSETATTAVPIGIGEIQVAGVPYLPLALPEQQSRRACGSGPTLRVDGRQVRTAVVASAAELMGTGSVRTEICSGPKRLALSGEVEVEVPRSAAFEVDALTLTAIDDPGELPPPTPAALDDPDAAHRTVTPGEDRAVLAVRENANRGWRAEQGNRELKPVVLDGWQQGFQLSNQGPVTMRFGPDRLYRIGLVLGLAGLLGLFVLAGWSPRRTDATLEAAPAEDLRLSPRWGGLLACAAALGIGGLLAGTAGVLLAAVLGGVLWAVPRGSDDAQEGLNWLVAAPVLLVGVVYSFGPWGGMHGWAGDWAWAGYLALVPLVALPVMDRGRRKGRMFFNRSTGRSSKR
ncbi:MAG: alpha-(1-_3)-arabinofuranosyltransferase [Nocardioidaceae bacterium]|nr:alpha-(1->3)-arabinofuranosyltransferase [Nocardioidaceae bacterium]